MHIRSSHWWLLLPPQAYRPYISCPMFLLSSFLTSPPSLPSSPFFFLLQSIHSSLLSLFQTSQGLSCLRVFALPFPQLKHLPIIQPSIQRSPHPKYISSWTATPLPPLLPWLIFLSSASQQPKFSFVYCLLSSL